MARRQLRFGRRRTSNRVLALSVIFFVLALTIAPPVKHYFTQRAQISALKAQLSADNSALEKARQELTLWQDPEYVKSQARERLHFVLPRNFHWLPLRKRMSHRRTKRGTSHFLK